MIFKVKVFEFSSEPNFQIEYLTDELIEDFGLYRWQHSQFGLRDIEPRNQ